MIAHPNARSVRSPVHPPPVFTGYPAAGLMARMSRSMPSSPPIQLRTFNGSYPLPESARSFRSHGPAIDHLPLNPFQSAIEITVSSGSKILRMLQHCHTRK